MTVASLCNTMSVLPVDQCNHLQNKHLLEQAVCITRRYIK